ncbi:integrin alpha-11-like, partial [Oncorhynchus masou masou]|uniref:integrin alpha-11-like n=1 Tax=Oncorhynchus masou masou TaxID=90313 RepID=UPI0031832CF1
MDDPDKLLFRNLTLLSGEETCQHIYFHVMETTDYVRPIVFTVAVALQDPDQGPALDDTWPTTFRTELPFWNGCDEDDRCTPGLSLQSTTDLLSWRQFCGNAVHSRGAMCRRLSEGGAEGSERVMEGSRRRMVVDVRLENRGENAYGARLNITYTPNLRFSSLIVK